MKGESNMTVSGPHVLGVPESAPMVSIFPYQTR